MPAGVSDGTIEDGAITATSFLDTSSKPSAGRLNSSNGAWCAKVSDKHQYLQIDLGMSVLKYILFCFAQSVKISLLFTESRKKALKAIPFRRLERLVEISNSFFFSNKEILEYFTCSFSVHAYRTTVRSYNFDSGLLFFGLG